MRHVIVPDFGDVTAVQEAAGRAVRAKGSPTSVVTVVEPAVVTAGDLPAACAALGTPIVVKPGRRHPRCDVAIGDPLPETVSNISYVGQVFVRASDYAGHLATARRLLDMFHVVKEPPPPRDEAD